MGWAVQGMLSEVVCSFRKHKSIKLNADVNIINEGKTLIVDFSFNLLRSHTDFKERREKVRMLVELLPSITSVDFICSNFLVAILRSTHHSNAHVVVKCGLKERRMKIRKPITGCKVYLTQQYIVSK